MKNALIPVTFLPQKKVVSVEPETTLYEAAIKGGFFIQGFCGGKGTCGKCKVKINNNQIPHTPDEISVLTNEERSEDIHLACKTTIRTPIAVEIPNYNANKDAQVLISNSVIQFALDSNIEKINLKIPEPALETQLADSESLLKTLNLPESVHIPLSLLQTLPGKIRDANFEVTIAIADKQILSVEAGNTTSEKLGIAFDLGTTTIVGALVNLYDGKSLGIAARTNPQSIHGADVISRINYCSTCEDGLQRLQTLVVGAFNEIIKEVLEKTGRTKDEVYEITIAGNATMNHLLLGVNPQAIAAMPYVPAFKKSQTVAAKELALDALPEALVHTLPNISGYVGGDINALILAFDIHHSDKMTLALDIGTNGEIVLGSRKRLLACSAAAGPAFEGGHISSGMRAASGAIDKVVMDNDDIKYHVIGDVAPVGLCGTGLIDGAAFMLKQNIIDSTGRIVHPDANISPALERRIVQENSNNNFLLAASTETQTNQPIFINQKDIRELQLAKGAIAAGIAVLMDEMGIGTNDIEQVLIAGAFGNFIDKNNTFTVGLIPNVDPNLVKFVGNSASLGAKKYLLSKTARAEARRINDFTEYVELSCRPDFQEKFMDAMMF